MRKLTILLALVGATLLLVPGTALAQGVSGPAIYVDGQAYRTVGTPTDFSQTGAPDHSFDTIYDIAGQMNVATAAPGDRDYNGGRWMVIGATWNVDPYDLFSEEEVLAAADAGDITLTQEPIKWFECPVIPSRGNA